MQSGTGRDARWDARWSPGVTLAMLLTTPALGQFTVSGAGIYAQGRITLNSDASIVSGNPTRALVATESTAGQHVIINAGALMHANIAVGVGGNAGHVILVNGGGVIAGATGTLVEERPSTVPYVPTGGNVHRTVLSSTTIEKGVFFTEGVSLNEGQTITIVGDVTMVCFQNFTVGSGCEVEVTEGSSLTLFVGGTFQLNSNSRFNVEQSNPDQATVYVHQGDVILNSNTGSYANVHAPAGSITLNTDCSFTGSFIGREVMVNARARFTAKGTGLAVQTADEPETTEGRGVAGGGGGSGAVPTRVVEVRVPEPNLMD